MVTPAHPLADHGALIAAGGAALTHNVPLSPGRARQLTAWVTDADPAAVLDVGCGSGALLVRCLLASSSARGHGVDVSPLAIDRARRAATQAGCADRAAFTVADAAGIPLMADVMVCVGSSHAVGGLGPLLQWTEAPRLLLGEGFWYGTQPLEWREAFGPLPSGLAGLAASATDAGWRVVRAEASDPWEFDAFERAWGNGVRRSGLPGANAFVDQRWAAYANGYRGGLGFGWLWLHR